MGDTGAGSTEIPAHRERPLLLLFRRPPYGTVYPAEGFRLAEAALAFQLPLRVVFLEDGVYNLVRGQGKGCLGFGDLGAAFVGLVEQGLPELIALEEDIAARGLGRGDLVDAPLRLIPVEELREIIEEARVVVPF
ncbi:MAG: DsrE family protein [Thermoplasmatota archaeon]